MCLMVAWPLVAESNAALMRTAVHHGELSADSQVKMAGDKLRRDARCKELDIIPHTKKKVGQGRARFLAGLALAGNARTEYRRRIVRDQCEVQLVQAQLVSKLVERM